jgi:hypothetical protein
MKLTHTCRVLLVACVVAIPSWANAEPNRELKVHLAQANNDSAYAFVRAKFNPGEVADPWAVRFFDDKGKEVPYFVWDSITWQVAREGRADWGKRYALINHGPGDAAEVVEARGRKLQEAKKHLPELGAKLQAQEEAADKAPDSVCAALYLLRYRTPAFGKQRVTMRMYDKRQVEPELRQRKYQKVELRHSVQQGPMILRNLPDQFGVIWKGKELFRSGGFQAGDSADTVSHADPSRPFVVTTEVGIISKVSITAQTKGRKDGAMDWQCTYWLFPEGCFVGLEGFSLTDTAGYVGGPQKLSIWEAEGKFTEHHVPLWEKPWWLHQMGDQGFVATHLFFATPLTIGYGNNPFTVNAEGPDKEPKVVADGNRLALSWSHRVDDPAITRLMVPQPVRRPNDPPVQPKPAAWKPKVDWLYRQYAAGLGDKAETAEGALRDVLGAAAGWIDRPVSEEELATLFIGMMPRIGVRQSSEIGLLKVVPALIANDQPAVKEALSKARDQSERTDFYINLIKDWVARGGRPSAGGKVDPDGTRREGWTGNACYHAALMPCYVRILEHFELPHKQKEYRESILHFADFTLEILGSQKVGEPPDFDKLSATFQSEWPSRIVPIIPLMLHAYTLKPEEKYARAAKVLFQEFMRRVERNPHGYFPVWTWNPKADKFDTVYNPVSYERGLTALWSDKQLDLVGRDTATKFVAAQARWFVFSGQLLDTLETDNATSIRACTHGGHTGNRNQIGIYLYDDCNFYRGLVADLVTWSTASCQVPLDGGPTAMAAGFAVGPYRSLELSNAGSSMLRWALDIRPGSKWLESKVEKQDKGFRLQAWNRLPQAKPTIKLTAKEVGLKSEKELLHVQLNEPAFRLPAEFDISWTADKVTLKLGRSAKLRLYYPELGEAYAGKEKPVLRRLDENTVNRDVVWGDGYVEWQATPGEYELKMAGK